MRLRLSRVPVGLALAAGCSGDPAGIPVADEPVVELAAVTAADVFVAVGTEIAVQDGAVVPGGDRAIAATSATGQHWAWIDTGHSGALLDVAHGGGAFVAVGYRTGTDAGAVVLRSADGVEWEEVATEGARMWMSVAWGNGRFVATGSDDRAVSLVAVSLDGREWDVVAESDIFSPRVVFALGAFHITGEAGVVFSSPDGEEWTTRALPGLNRITGLAEVNGRLLGSGIWDCCFGEMPERIEYYTVRSDEAGELHASESGLRQILVGHAAGAEVVVALSGLALYRSVDGETWSVAYEPDEGAFMLDLLYARERFVVVGRRFIVTSVDGEEWTRTPIPERVAGR